MTYTKLNPKNSIYVDNIGSISAGSGVTVISGTWVREMDRVAVQIHPGNVDKYVSIYGAVWSGTQAGFVSGPALYNPLAYPNVWSPIGTGFVASGGTSYLKSWEITDTDFVAVTTSGAASSGAEIKLRAKTFHS
jgi:hypothetical protein